MKKYLSILIIAWFFLWSVLAFADSHQVKPTIWACDSGTVAYNCARMGLPMPSGLWVWPGGNWPDLSGNRINGTITGAALKSGGLYFDGTGNRVNCGTSSLLKTTSFTLFSRFKYDSVNQSDSHGTILSNRLNNKGHQIAIEKATRKLWWATTLNWAINYTDYIVPVNDRCTLIFVYDENHGTTVYVDGVQIDYDNTTGANTYDVASVFTLGVMSDEVGVHDYTGFIDVSAHFPKAFSFSQVRVLNNNPHGMFDPIRWPIWDYGGAAPPSTFPQIIMIQ